MSNIALIDFDKTLINLDSIKHIMLEEQWYLKPKILIAGLKLTWALKITQNSQKEINERSKFKSLLLDELSKMSEQKMAIHIQYFKKELNIPLINFINKQNYDKKLVISASEKKIIRKTLVGTLEVDEIIANEIAKDYKDFKTCWGLEKVLRIENREWFQNSDYDLYTDSFDDKPLMDTAQCVYLVRHEKIEKIKG